MKWLVLVFLLCSCCDCKPFAKTRLDSRLDNRWEGPTLTEHPMAGIKCRF